MNLLNQFKLPAIAGILLVVGFMSSCEQDLTTIGEGVIGGEPFATNKQTFDVFAFNKKIEAVQTNQLPIYQLGVYNDPVYGKTEASITSQVQLSIYNPSFGDYKQSDELSGENSAIIENERVDSVYIYIPFLNNQIDTDIDGVVDDLDDEPNDATNDTDGDGIPNNEEVANNTNPNNEDTDNDGIKDGDDDATLGDRFPKTFKLDSIYYNNEKIDESLKLTPPYIGKEFNFKVERSTFFLRDLDPDSNFQESQEYFSTQEFSPDFTDEVFFDGKVSISNQEIVFLETVDDPDTDTDEKGSISSRLAPGIYVKLNEVAKTFFQENFLNKEGSADLLTSANFKEFFRGIHLSTSTVNEDIMMLLDMTGAQINVYYTYDDNVVDAEPIPIQKVISLNLISQLGTAAISVNAVNTFVNEDYPAGISNSLDTGENTDKIYLKGGAGSYAEIKLFDEVDTEAEALINQIKANNWIINEAKLVFHIDTDLIPVNSIEPARLYLYNAETNEPIYNTLTENSLEDSALGVYLNYDGILEESNNKGLKYTVNITEHINNIIVRDSVNAKLGLAISPDIRLAGANNAMLSGDVEKELPAASILSPLGTVLFGSNLPAENEKKLKLEIFYTETTN